MITIAFRINFFDIILKVTPILLSLATLIILILGYRRFLQNQLRTKQLETVHEFIKQIQQGDWHYLHFNKYENAPSKAHIATIFDIADMDEFDENSKLYFWGIDNEPPEEKLLSWDFFFKFHSNPLLPISIAKPLKKFSLWRQQSNITVDMTKEEKYIAIGRKKTVPENAYYFFLPNSNLSTCKGFKETCIELRDAIIKWTNKFGLKDINITTSHLHKIEIR